MKKHKAIIVDGDHERQKNAHLGDVHYGMSQDRVAGKNDKGA